MIEVKIKTVIYDPGGDVVQQRGGNVNQWQQRWPVYQLKYQNGGKCRQSVNKGGVILPFVMLK